MRRSRCCLSPSRRRSRGFWSAAAIVWSGAAVVSETGQHWVERTGAVPTRFLPESPLAMPVRPLPLPIRLLLPLTTPERSGAVAAKLVAMIEFSSKSDPAAHVVDAAAGLCGVACQGVIVSVRVAALSTAAAGGRRISGQGRIGHVIVPSCRGPPPPPRA